MAGWMLASAASALGFVACSSFSASPSAVDAATDAPIDAFVPPDGARDPLDASTPPDALMPIMDASFRSSTVQITVSGADSYAIEATEVTVAQFRAFTIDVGVAYGSPWPSCPGKKALGPNPGCTPSTLEQQPVTCVDVCDATLYCAAIGRRLCGRIGGIPAPSDTQTALVYDEWSHACGGPTATAFPYGPSPMLEACTTTETGAAVPETVGMRVACQGGANGGTVGLFDMSGNVKEWTNDCDNGDAGCAVYGGSFRDQAYLARCDDGLLVGPATYYDDVGFRCCAAEP